MFTGRMSHTWGWTCAWPRTDLCELRLPLWLYEPESFPVPRFFDHAYVTGRDVPACYVAGCFLSFCAGSREQLPLPRPASVRSAWAGLLEVESAGHLQER